ncbi:MAG: hypothetical protein KFF73_13455 [Cyclobacteriaceae bacterium]|nr:hypothetical protein [Cyclobacteriaceae bacterium]
MNTIFDIKENEIVFIYNSDRFRDREARGYMKSVEDYKVREIDISKDQVTETQLMDISDRLEISPAQLLDTHSDEYVNAYGDADLEKEDIIKSIRQKPALLNTPIALYRHKAYFVQTPYDLVRKGLTDKGIDPEER